MMGAHRLSWELHNGPIPPGLVVCHKCDNPPCVNPDHLFLGTQGDNLRDRDAKGKHNVRLHPELERGERNPNSRLSAVQISEIRRLASDNSQRGLGRMFGVSGTQIRRILSGEQWGHVVIS